MDRFDQQGEDRISFAHASYPVEHRAGWRCERNAVDPPRLGWMDRSFDERETGAPYLVSGGYQEVDFTAGGYVPQAVAACGFEPGHDAVPLGMHQRGFHALSRGRAGSREEDYAR
ncbi:hypothetical protein GCM10027199_39380 [Amycolatopsis magusensis]